MTKPGFCGFNRTVNSRTKTILKGLRQVFIWGVITAPMIAFFLPLDRFFLIGTIACVLMVLDVVTFWKALKHKGSYWFMVFTVFLAALSFWQNNLLGLMACGFLLLIVIYFTYLRYVMTPLIINGLVWIVGLGSLLSLYYTTVNFYGPDTVALYEFFIKYIPLGFSFISGVAGDPNPASTFISSNFYGHISAVIALISVAMIAEGFKGLRRHPIYSAIKVSAFIGVLGVNLYALDLTISWSAHLGLVAGVMVFALVKDWRWFLAISVVVVLVAWRQPQWLLEFFPPTDDWVMSAEYRFKLYAAAWQEVQKHPWIGRGLYTYPTVYKAYDTGYQVHTHNLMLEFLLSGGIAGVVLFGAYVKSVLGQAVKQWITKGHPRMALFWGMVALELANGLTDAVIVFPQSFVLFCLVLLMTEVETSRKSV